MIFRTLAQLFLTLAFSFLVSCYNNQSYNVSTPCNGSDYFVQLYIDDNDAFLCNTIQHNDPIPDIDSLYTSTFKASNETFTFKIIYCYKSPNYLNVDSEDSYREFFNYFEKLYSPRTAHVFDSDILQHEGSIVVELVESDIKYSTLYGPQIDSEYTPYQVTTEYRGILDQVTSSISISGNLSCTVYSQDGKNKKEINTYFESLLYI